MISCFKSNINNQAYSGAKFCIWQTMTMRGLPPSLFHTFHFLNWVPYSSFWFIPSAPPIHATKLVIISNNWVTLTATHRKYYWQLKTVWTVILKNKTYIIISHNHTSEMGVESASAHLCDILWFSEVCRCRHGNSKIQDRTFLVSQKVNESVPQSFTLIYTFSFSVTFLDVNFRGTKALKLCTMIH
jgi:hypothetical protein